jgi:hypothetical protein
VGKLVLAFLFSIASAALALHEARPPARVATPPPTRPQRRALVPDRVNVPESADPRRFARPFYIRSLPAPPPPEPPRRELINDEEVDGPEPPDSRPIAAGDTGRTAS